MKKLVRSSVVAAATCLQMAVCQSATAETSSNQTVEALLNRCNADVNTAPLDVALCAGFVGGIGDALLNNGRVRKVILNEQKQLDENSIRALTSVSICSSTGITPNAMIQAFKNWATRHPEDWGIPEGGGVAAALHETWPC